MERTYITTANGHELPMGSERNPAAALHFALVRHTSMGAQVWECREIRGRHLALRLSFTSRFNDEHVQRTGHPMGELLYRQMLKQEEVAAWENELATHGWHSHAAVA